ncbi:MAG: hypothetical protein M1422_03815 [Candidatus Thermoplasmatota archaeon]|nr:hypothetical protein [Candidatus Thermoplasmatota archaeon]
MAELRKRYIKENYVMVKKAHFPYGRYIFREENGETYASWIPLYRDKRIEGSLNDPDGKALLNSIMDVRRIPEHGGLMLFTIYDAGGGVAATFMKPPGIRLIGEQHYAVMVDDSVYLRLDDTSGRGNYSILALREESQRWNAQKSI